MKPNKTECALEGCDEEFIIVKNYPFYVELGYDNKKAFFCSEKCHYGFMEWAVWQKDLGNGIESQPPFYGNSIKNKFR